MLFLIYIYTQINYQIYHPFFLSYHLFFINTMAKVKIEQLVMQLQPIPLSDHDSSYWNLTHVLDLHVVVPKQKLHDFKFLTNAFYKNHHVLTMTLIDDFDCLK